MKHKKSFWSGVIGQLKSRNSYNVVGLHERNIRATDLKNELTGRRVTDRGMTGFGMATGKVTGTSYDKKDTC